LGVGASPGRPGRGPPDQPDRREPDAYTSIVRRLREPAKEKDPNGNLTETTYNTAWNSLPTRKTNAKGHATEWYYYGLNGTTSTTTAGYSLGKLERLRDVANGADTWYQYDPLATDRCQPARGQQTEPYGGLCLLRWQPLPPSPTLQASWRSGRPPPRLGAGGTWERRFYDGLGRLVQVQAPTRIGMASEGGKRRCASPPTMPVTSRPRSPLLI